MIAETKNSFAVISRDGNVNEKQEPEENTLKKIAVFIIVALVGFIVAAVTPSFAGEPAKLALQISDNDAEKMNAVLNVAANVSKSYSAKGEEVQIEIVAFNAGLHMLREDTSPVKPRLISFKQSMNNVTFRACQNTLDGMTKREGKVPPLVDNAQLVPEGVVTLIKLAGKGYTIIRP